MALLDIGFVLIGFIGGLIGGYLVRDLFRGAVGADVIEPYFDTKGNIAGFTKKG